MDNYYSASGIILTAIQQAGRSQLWLSNETGIPYTTLGRKLKGQSDFLLCEVGKIALALDVSAGELLPAPFKEVA